MLLRKTCTTCGLEYQGDFCPECAKNNPVKKNIKKEKIQKINKHQQKKKKKQIKENNELLQDKIQQLIDKYNN